MNWKVIFRDAVPSVAGVTIYEKEDYDLLGKFTVAKTMKCKDGTIRHTQNYCWQRPAAMRRAVEFLKVRASMFGTCYVPGEGSKTLAFAPVVEGGAS